MAPDDDPVQLGPFRIELVRMAHSIPDAAAVVLETPGGLCVHTGDYKLDHTPVDGQRTDVGKLAAVGNRGVDLLLGDSTNAERPGFTQSERVVGEAFRQLIPHRTGPHPRHLVRVERPPDAAGRRRRRRVRTQGRLRRPLDAQEREHRPEPRLHGRSGRADHAAARALRAAAGAAADPLHRQPGRADVRDDPDRLQRPSVRAHRARRHGDHLREADPGERAPRPRRDQPAREVGRRGAARGQRPRPRLRPRLLGGAAHDPRTRPPEGRDADARRVPDARRARAARARGRRPRRQDHPRRERQRRRARLRDGAPNRRQGGRRHRVRRRPRRRRRARRRAPRPAQARRGRRPDRRRDARLPERRRPDGVARADRPRLRRRRRAAARRAPRRGAARPRRAPRRRRDRDQAPPGAPPRSARRHRLQPHAPAADDPAGDRARSERAGLALSSHRFGDVSPLGGAGRRCAFLLGNGVRRATVARKQRGVGCARARSGAATGLRSSRCRNSCRRRPGRT